MISSEHLRHREKAPYNLERRHGETPIHLDFPPLPPAPSIGNRAASPVASRETLARHKIYDFHEPLHGAADNSSII